MAGIVHFANFYRWMEETEHEYFRSLGLSDEPAGLETQRGVFDHAVEVPGGVDLIRRLVILLRLPRFDLLLANILARIIIEMCDQGRLVFLEEATHWVQHEEPEAVNAALVEFLKG